MANYYEQIAQIRQQRAQQDIVQRVEQIKADLAETTQYRDAAAGQYHGAADQETRDENCASWHALDRECAQLEAELAQFVPQGPQLSPKDIEFLQQNQPYIDRYGDRALQNIGHADGYLTRPKNPTARNPAQTGMGLARGSPEYYTHMKNLLEMYGKDYGAPYDPAEQQNLSANEVCRMNRISADTYNRQWQRMINEGKDSGTLYGAHWKRRTG